MSKKSSAQWLKMEKQTPDEIYKKQRARFRKRQETKIKKKLEEAAKKGEQTKLWK